MVVPPLRLVSLGLVALGACAGCFSLTEPRVARLTVSQETTVITEPLREDGTPDYALWFNRRYGAGVTPDNNAALPLMGAKLVRQPRDVLAAMGLDPAQPPARLGLVERINRKEFFQQRSRALKARWSDEEAPLVVEWLGANERVRGRLAEIVRSRPRYWIPMRGDFAIDTETPSLLEWRTLGELCWAAALRVGRGHQDAHAELGTGFRLAALLDQGPTAIERLVGVTIQAAGAEAVVALANPPAGPAAARSLLDEIERVPASPPFIDAVANDRLGAVAGHVELYRAAARSPEAWRARTQALAQTMSDMANGLGMIYSSRWPLVPPWAIDWDEMLRFTARCRTDPACHGELKVARADLRRPTLAWLIWAARHDPAARRRIARALAVDEPPTFGDFPTQSEADYARPWNESQALRRVARVASAAALRRAEDRRYPSDAAALGPGLTAPGDGYAFAYSASADGISFTFTAVPEKPKQTGIRGFCADSLGRLAQTRDGTAPATAGKCSTAP